MTVNASKIGPVRLIVLPDKPDRTKAGGKALTLPPSPPCKPSLSTKAANTLTDKADFTDKTGAKRPMRVVVDSREQSPFRFEGYPCTVQTGTLASADYSLRGFTDRIGIERKSLPDLIGCLSTDRKRFEAELVRLRGFDACAVVVESPASDLRAGRYRSQMDSGAAWQSCLALSVRCKIPFWFCDSRADAERTTFDLLRHFVQDRLRELLALQDGGKIGLAGTTPVRARAC